MLVKNKIECTGIWEFATWQRGIKLKTWKVLSHFFVDLITGSHL